jgi:hypothetical protein
MSDSYSDGWDDGYSIGYESGRESAGLEHKTERLRLLFANYLRTEGCYCCQDEAHESIGDEIAEMLDMPRHGDDSGIDWSKVIEDSEHNEH